MTARQLAHKYLLDRLLQARLAPNVAMEPTIAAGFAQLRTRCPKLPPRAFLRTPPCPRGRRVSDLGCPFRFNSDRRLLRWPRRHRHLEGPWNLAFPDARTALGQLTWRFLLESNGVSGTLCRR